MPLVPWFVYINCLLSSVPRTHTQPGVSLHTVSSLDQNPGCQQKNKLNLREGKHLTQVAQLKTILGLSEPKTQSFFLHNVAYLTENSALSTQGH